MASTRSGGRGSRGGGGGSRRANNSNSNAGNNNNNAGNNNTNAAEQQTVAAALAEVNAGDPAEAANYQNVRNALTTNGGFPNAVGGATDKFLLSAGGIFRDQLTLARSDPKEIDAAVIAQNRQNKGFGQGITPQHSSFLHGFPHVFQAQGGARDQGGPQPQFADMVLGEGYWIPIVYLTVPLVINTANIDHAVWAAVPLLGIAYNRDNAMFYRILQPIVAKSKYKAFLLEFRGGQDGRRLWLKILSMEMSEGNRYQIVANLKKVFNMIYDGKSANLKFLTWYTALKSAYNVMHDNKEPTTCYTRIENTMKKMNLKDYPSLQATISAVRVSPDKRKREAGDDKGEEVEEILCDGVDCCDYLVLSSGKLAIPDRVWNRSSVQFRGVGRFNRAVDKHNTSVRRDARKKKQEDEDAHSDDDKDGGDNAKDRKIQALMARVEALEEERKDEKGSSTGGRQHCWPPWNVMLHGDLERALDCGDLVYYLQGGCSDLPPSDDNSRGPFEYDVIARIFRLEYPGGIRARCHVVREVHLSNKRSIVSSTMGIRFHSILNNTGLRLSVRFALDARFTRSPIACAFS
ncbi:hypothetical protein THAOC_13410 [Thalassiosira oceanica]|uniref:Uncharacterized protein n=1 Tax=Thalassiosira oceanica TaxID=159749 RepID=K0SXK4_THAOC|nr:hypothetical protein THAOC_13410 [Thalassiosira oceanica]|eukprot:EJK65706.1 hypothetical protein THAOC_13410 [Thalassiosira oceanica]